MRRWVCIVALLAGFTGQDYVRFARLREPVAVERLIGRIGPGGQDDHGGHGDGRPFAQTGAWWARPAV